MSAIVVGLALGFFLTGGCASPGPPRAPSLNLPETVSSLKAERTGDRVLLRWTTPAKSTDDLDVRGPMIAEICRTLPPQPAALDPCPPILRIPVAPGDSQATDTLPPALIGGPVRLIAYRVRILNQRERSVGLSPATYTAGGPAPEPVQQLRAANVERGVLLQWQTATNDPVELHRATMPQASTSNRQSQPPDELRLEVPAGARNEGGAVDGAVKDGATYSYTAQRVRKLRIEGQTIEIRSAVSAAVTITPRDTFPPSPPSGLTAIVDGRSVDLSWRPNTEPDLAGYVVFRQEDGASAPEALNPRLLDAPAFHDAALPPGGTVRYTVVAVDKSGNRSAPSEAASATLP